MKIFSFIKVTKLSTKWIWGRIGLKKLVLFKDIRDQTVVYVVVLLITGKFTLTQ